MTADAQGAHGEGLGYRPAGEFGVWVFLGSEALLFGAVILVYLVARIGYGEAFAAASRELSLPLGTINTAVLLTSSFAVALALIAAEAGKRRRARLLTLATAGLGVAFLCIKAYEWFDEARHDLLPVLGLPFRYDGPDPDHARLFFDAYLALTGLHALHLVSGVLLMIGVTFLWRRFERPVEVLRMSALYWHFIDVVWVFLFPMLYMVR